MIRKSNPLSIVEAKEYLGEKKKELEPFIKKFEKINLSKTKELKEVFITCTIMNQNFHSMVYHPG